MIYYRNKESVGHHEGSTVQSFGTGLPLAELKEVKPFSHGFQSCFYRPSLIEASIHSRINIILLAGFQSQLEIALLFKKKKEENKINKPAF